VDRVLARLTSSGGGGKVASAIDVAGASAERRVGHRAKRSRGEDSDPAHDGARGGSDPAMRGSRARPARKIPGPAGDLPALSGGSLRSPNRKNKTRVLGLPSPGPQSCVSPPPSLRGGGGGGGGGGSGGGAAGTVPSSIGSSTSIGSSSSSSSSSSRTPGSMSALLRRGNMGGFTDPSAAESDPDFQSGPWLHMIASLGLPAYPPALPSASPLLAHNIAWAKQHAGGPSRHRRGPLVVSHAVSHAGSHAGAQHAGSPAQQGQERGAVSKARVMLVLLHSLRVTPTDALATLKDPTGVIKATVHGRLLEEYPEMLTPGAALVLQVRDSSFWRFPSTVPKKKKKNVHFFCFVLFCALLLPLTLPPHHCAQSVSLFRPTPNAVYLNVTPENLVKLFPAGMAAPSSVPASPVVSQALSTHSANSGGGGLGGGGLGGGGGGGAGVVSLSQISDIMDRRGCHFFLS
jgi:hypothetical protein